MIFNLEISGNYLYICNVEQDKVNSFMNQFVKNQNVCATAGPGR